MKRTVSLFPVSAFLAFLLLSMNAASVSAGQFEVPKPGYAWSFPRDHANHPDYAVEWWYYTGHLLPEGADPAVDANWLHLQLTFFRTAIPGQDSGSLYFAHLAISGDGHEFHYAERIARGTLDEAGSDNPVYNVWLDDWRATRIAEEDLLEAYDPHVGGIRLLARPHLGPVLNGDKGYSSKGPGGNEASYYYSMPDMEARGWFLPPADDQGKRPEPVAVSGTLWMDHEFGNQQMGTGLAGWDWWGLELPDGNALMLYLIRKVDGTPVPQSAGTYTAKNGSTTQISLDEMSVTPTSTWTSPHSGATYPYGWTISVPKLNLDLTVTPVRKDQELRTNKSTRVTYYEGAVRVEQKGTPGRSFGFVELVGYDHGKKAEKER